MEAQRKKKGPKKKEKGKPVETAAAMEIEKVAFGDFSLMISTAAWKSLREKRFGFSTITTDSATTNYSTTKAIVI